MIIENYFFLAAGVLALGFGIGHAIWGQRFILGDVRSSEMPVMTKHMLIVIWNQPTVFHCLAAIGLVAVSTFSNRASAGPLAVFIGLVTLGFLLNYVGTSLMKNRSALTQIVPQALAVTLYLGIIAGGVIM